MRKNNKTFGDWVSVVIAFIGGMLFASVFVACYVWFFMNPSIASFIGAFWMSTIPGLMAYGIFGAIIDFIRNK